MVNNMSMISLQEKSGWFRALWGDKPKNGDSSQDFQVDTAITTREN